MANFVDSFRTSIESLGLSSTTMWIIAGVFFVASMITWREVVAWFLKTSSLQRDTERILDILDNLENRLEKLEDRAMQIESVSKKHMQAIETMDSAPEMAKPQAPEKSMTMAGLVNSSSKKERDPSQPKTITGFASFISKDKKRKLESQFPIQN